MFIERPRNIAKELGVEMIFEENHRPDFVLNIADRIRTKRLIWCFTKCATRNVWKKYDFPHKVKF